MSEFSLTLDSLAPYIEGQAFTGAVTTKIRPKKSILEDFLTMIEEDDVAKEFLTAYEHANDFYDTMTDFKHFIPKEYRQEVFYAAKLNGEFYNEVPSFCVYMLKKAWQQCNGIPNLIFKILPVNCIKEFFKEGYLRTGFTMRDVICNICSEEYNPISKAKPRNKVGNFTEFYVAKTDMVAALPNAIAELLTDDCCEMIDVTPSGLAVNGLLLRTRANYVGAINSIYDLRELL